MNRRVLMINPEFPPIGGGAANMNRYFLEEASKLSDIDIDLITSSTTATTVDYDFGTNVRIWKLKVWKKKLHYWTHRELMTYLIRAGALARKLIYGRKFNVLHAVFGYPSGLLAYWLRDKLPYIVSLRGSDVPGFNNRFSTGYTFTTPLVRRVWNSAAAVTSNSVGLRDLAHETCPELDIDVIPNGVDTREFAPGLAAKGVGVRVLTVARLIERKGIHFLIRAFERVNMEVPYATLSVVGAGNMEAELEMLVERSNLKDKVSFLGEIPHAALPSIYSSHDLFVLPSLNEGMSNVIMEAMASGLPIIATSTGGTRELLNGNVVLVNPTSPQDISSAIIDLARDSERRQRMGDISMKIVEDYSWRKMVQGYLELYDRVIAGV